jgi:hypothetical protein
MGSFEKWKESLHSWNWRVWPFKQVNEKKSKIKFKTKYRNKIAPWQPSTVINYQKFDKLLCKIDR